PKLQPFTSGLTSRKQTFRSRDGTVIQNLHGAQLSPKKFIMIHLAISPNKVGTPDFKAATA
ncbi:hypothetical protein NPN18_25220, partial [Vibrio parahaemolyticus]|nr:hypothetical protein [Vibrio parahaemolyticus]